MARPGFEPHRLHEKDVIVVDLDPAWKPRPADELYPIQRESPPDHVRDLLPHGHTLERFGPAFRRGAQVICLLEAEVKVAGVSGRWQTFGWIPGAGLKRRAALG